MALLLGRCAFARDLNVDVGHRCSKAFLVISQLYFMPEQEIPLIKGKNYDATT